MYTLGLVLGLIQFIYIGSIHYAFHNLSENACKIIMGFWFAYHSFIEYAKLAGQGWLYFWELFNWLNLAKLGLMVGYIMIFGEEYTNRF